MRLRYSYSGKWRNNTEVAVRHKLTQAFLQEAAIMKKFRSRPSGGAVCSLLQRGTGFIVQEYMKHGSLLEFLHKEKAKHLQFGDLIYIAAQVRNEMI
ncbi:hypothetical protein LSTR_LSTR011075 [Laodelphax striatellus]|uniref:Serine-threonine/tyrosine-protein kinase catalytic domain-containing protein n=1 Tax=Laodelphax striatellus TaxID=195883 RepID=A0A482XSQ4_LAOST|nr:hypothetical protein LSTR_LSTR011075 [Laodelphax striatellus]